MIYLAASNPGLINLLFMLGIVLVMYFFFIRPQAKRQKEQASFSESLKKGDEVVTASGLIGKISKVEGNTVQVQLDQKTFVRMLASAINKEMTESYRKSNA